MQCSFILQVWNMSVHGPAVGMDQVECAKMDEIVLDQSGCSMIAAGSPLGSPTSVAANPAGGNSANTMSNLELGAAAASGSEQWALGAMPVRPGALRPEKSCTAMPAAGALLCYKVVVLHVASALCRSREARRQVWHWRGAHAPKGLTTWLP